ncbi:unnamed protein product [Sympodiomycopsis kandeliae]
MREQVNLVRHTGGRTETETDASHAIVSIRRLAYVIQKARALIQFSSGSGKKPVRAGGPPFIYLLKSIPSITRAMTTVSKHLPSLVTRLSELGYATPTLLHQSIRWGDSDILKHVNNVHYVKFFESSRMQFIEHVADNLQDTSKKQDLIQGVGIGIILAEIRVKYRRPVTYPDSLLIGVKLSEELKTGTDRFTLQAAAYSLKSWEAYQAKKQQSAHETREPGPVCVADQLCVTYDYDPSVLSKAPMPEDLRLAMQKATAVDN